MGLPLASARTHQTHPKHHPQAAPQPLHRPAYFLAAPPPAAFGVVRMLLLAWVSPHPLLMQQAPNFFFWLLPFLEAPPHTHKHTHDHAHDHA